MGSIKHSNKKFAPLIFQKSNYMIILAGISILISGYLIMASDGEEYGYGLLGLTIGPIVVLLGFTTLFFSIFKNYHVNSEITFPIDDKDITQSGFKRINTITGWIIFLISLSIYSITAEPTVSLWDCGEFIAASYKLQIPHPPGTPLFLLFGRFFSLFAPNKEWIAFSINMVSVVASSFTILILFHSIIILGRKFYKTESSDIRKHWLLIIAASIGSLCFAFSDSFWFNATEAEVYALSCLFTALVFWTMLKWMEQQDSYKEDKWLLLLAYLIGLSVGVHLLNLVAIPALAFIFYFKKYTVNWKGILLTLIISFVLILFFMEGIVIGVPSLAAFFDRIFVNIFRMPFGSGLIIFFIALITLLGYGFYYSLKNEKRWIHIGVLALIFTIAGSSSNIIIPIRSAYNPPIDENDPEDIMSLILYLKRDQYGSRPLLKGPYFTAGYPEKVTRKSPRYRKDVASGKYVVYDYDYEYEYNKKHMTLFPRLHSPEERHAEAYRQWLGLKKGKKPTMKDNLRFLWEYQLGHMFWRYFFWNFAGRESDVQDADWIKPTQWFDNTIPDLIKNNKARNNYFMIPLVLGLLGGFYHFKKRQKDWWIVLLLFIFSGIAINVYLNQPPTEPRERDYTYIGAFFAFSIWIGFSVFLIADFFSRIIKSKNIGLVLTLLISLSAPAIMVIENWDDHDRTGRYFAEDIAKNMLQSCEKTGILFTAADNDTFPLWYVQEAENFRTDVRICNLSLLNMDWYIRAMKRKSNASEPLPVSLEENNFIKGKNDQIYLMENPAYQKGINLKNYLELVKSDDRTLKHPAGNDDEVTIIPGSRLFLNIDKDILKSNKIDSNVSKRMEFQLQGNIGKAELIVLDIISTNNWKRPVYFDQSSMADYPYLRQYTVKEGILFRLLPFKSQERAEAVSNTDTMYQNLLKKFSWRGLNNPKVYTDPASAPFIANARTDFFNLAVSLFNENKTDKAKEVLMFSLNTIPDHCMPYDYTIGLYPELLFALKEDTLAVNLCEILAHRSLQYLSYLSHHGREKERTFQYYLYILNEVSATLEKGGKDELSKKYKERAAALVP
jgi:hypothetical protein